MIFWAKNSVEKRNPFEYIWNKQYYKVEWVNILSKDKKRQIIWLELELYFCPTET